jgi:plastocyanin
MPRAVSFVPLRGRLLLLAVLAGAMVLVSAGSRASAAETFNVWAGAESSDAVVQLAEFVPETVTVNEGDTISWRVPSEEFHTVTFLSDVPNPGFIILGPQGPMIHPLAAFPTGSANYDGTGVASSGLLEKDGTYSLTFTRAGTYEYVCLVHPPMVGTVVVRPAGQAADTPAAVAAAIAPHVNQQIAQRALPLLLSDVMNTRAEGAAAVVAGSGDGQASTFAFMPGETRVHVGDFVTWINKEPGTPHTVTFLDDNDSPEVVIPIPQQGGPPMLLLNPEVLMSNLSESGEYSGEGFLNSGFIGTPPESPTNTFTVRFTEAGTYDYICILHPWSMRGTVTVVE